MTQKVLVPELGEGIDKVTIACWHVKEGDTVKKEDDVAEIVTDKATFNVSAPADGIIKNILIKDGGEAAIGDAIGLIDSAAS